MTVTTISSLEQFRAIINDESKVAAIDFWATWCGPCRVISPMFDKLSAESPADQMAFYKVDVDEQPEIAQEAGIRSMPTFIFFKGGHKLDSVTGAFPPQLQKAVTSLLA